MTDTEMAFARKIVKQFYPEMRDDYSGRRVQIVLAALATRPDHVEKLAEALRPFALAARKGEAVYIGVQRAMKNEPEMFSYSTAYIDAGRSTASAHLTWNDYRGASEALAAYDAAKGEG